MKDVLFIERMLQRGKEADEKVKSEFAGISLEQLNWKPAKETWSIGQCLDHLIKSDSAYFPIFQKIAGGKFKMIFWEKWSPFTGLFGRIMVQQLQEKVKMKLKSPGIFVPSFSRIDVSIIEHFQKHLDVLLDYVAACKTMDLDKTHITSPASKFITYSLRNVITLLIGHEHRHITQAIRVRQSNDFPAV